MSRPLSSNHRRKENVSSFSNRAVVDNTVLRSENRSGGESQPHKYADINASCAAHADSLS
jgi:hypothetical protein